MRRAAAAAAAAVAAASPPSPRLARGLAGGVPEGAIVFDRALKRAHRDRAAWMGRYNAKDDALTAEIAARTVDRLLDCRRSFPRALILGGAGRAVLTALADGGVGASVGLEVATVVDASGAQLARVADAAGPGWPRLDLVEGDEEGVDLGEGRFDVAISALALHWVNDLPGLLTRVRRSLAPDGLFVASLWGGDATLRELRSSFAAAEMTVAGGLSPRVAPTVRAADAGGLLTRAGLALPGVDVDQLVVRYSGGPRAAVAHLRAMADSNAVVRRAPFLPRAVAAAAMEGYAKEYGDADGSVPATFEAVFLTGWALPEKGGGPVPAARGSGTVSLRDLEAALREKKE